MAYTSVPPTAAGKMGDELKELDKKLKALEKAKGDKTQIANLKKEIETKSKAMGKKMDDDVALIDKNATDYFQKVDAWAGQCEAFLKAAKDALERFKKTGQGGDMMTIEGGPSTILAMAQIASKDNDEFGKSWFQYRTFNPTINGLDKKYCAAFSKKRADIMNMQKGYGAKIDRMEMLAKQAEGLVKLAKSLEAGQSRDLEDTRKEAQSMRNEVATFLKDILSTPKINFNNLKTNTESIGTAAKAKSATKDHFNTMQGIFKNAVAIHKGITNRVKTMADLIKNGKASVKDASSDATVKAALDAADKDLKTAQDNQSEATKLMQQATKDLAAVGKMAK